MQEHPMQPSGFLLDQWELQAKALVGSTNHHDKQAIRQGSFGVVHRKALCLAYAAGADHELEACIAWMAARYGEESHAMGLLRSARRPKPPRLREQALEAVSRLCASVIHDDLKDDAAIVRRALESIPD
jgi:hypothetical protein